MFGMLVDRYQEAFLRKAAYILHSSEAAEDAVQDTFLKIYKYSHKFSEQENASFSSWAYKILVNTCFDHASRKALDRDRTQQVEFGNLDILPAPEVDNAFASDKLSFVQSVLSRLPENLSRLMSLYFFEEKTYEEIAEAEQISLSAVRSGLHRAKKKFKNIAPNLI